MGAGRRRDPQMAGRVVATTTGLIAANGMARLNCDLVASEARIGKASLYRRWPGGLPDLLVDVVADLGVRLEELLLQADIWAEGLRDDLHRLFVATGSGPRAVAEVALLPVIGHDERLVNAYTRGPLARQYAACWHVATRERMRGRRLPSHAADVMYAGVALLHQRMAITGRQVQPAWIDDALDYSVLPALGREPVRS